MLEQYIKTIHDYFYSFYYNFNPIPSIIFVFVNILEFLLLLLLLAHLIQIFKSGFKKEYIASVLKDSSFLLILAGLQHILIAYYNIALSAKPS